jgi:proteasome assembly chaperone (PAC2) family protein
MAINFIKEPRLRDPIMIASWPGIGNIGIIAVNALRVMLKAEEFAEIEPWEFFYPQKVVIKDGELHDLVFPSSKFYYKRTETRDLVFFVGEEQPTEGDKAYAEGATAYSLAGLVLDVAAKLKCRRVYTSGAAVAPVHHTSRPRVWAVPNRRELVAEMRRYDNTVIMSDIEEREGRGNISGLNGLLLGVARRRGIEAVCLMGEIPVYLQGFPIPYPKASRSVLEVLAAAIGLDVNLAEVDELVQSTEADIEQLYQTLSPETKEQLDKLKRMTIGKSDEPRPITEEDKRKILEDIDKFFKQGSEGD